MVPDPPFHSVYRSELRRLHSYGDVRSPRDQKTWEAIGVQFTCDPTRPLTGRPGWSERFALTETAQVIAGRGDIRQLRELAPQFESMAPSYVTYGPRISWMLGHVANMLAADPESRQAVVQVHEPGDTGRGYPEDPCTLSLQFLQRDARLHLVTTMRSNDAWLGTPTDVYMFTLLQREMATVLGVRPGAYIHQAGSFHLYERNLEAYLAMGAPPDSADELRDSLGCDSWAGVQAHARQFLDGEEVLPWSGWLG